jgi:hypothetical protein
MPILKYENTPKFTNKPGFLPFKIAFCTLRFGPITYRTGTFSIFFGKLED